MHVQKVTIETVTLDETDIIQAIVFLLREKGYKEVKAEQISIEPDKIKAVCKIQNEQIEN